MKTHAAVLTSGWEKIRNNPYELDKWEYMGITNAHSIFWNKVTGELVRVGDKVIKYTPANASNH